MKISSLFNKVSFKKTLVAHCSILKKDNVSFPCKIYSLNQKDDSDYFETIENKADWKGAKYLCYLKDDLKSIDDKPNRNIYVLQSEQGDCLGYSEIDYGENGIDEVLFLETVPTQNYSRRDKSSFKYIGETLLSFLLKKSKEKKAIED